MTKSILNERVYSLSSPAVKILSSPEERTAHRTSALGEERRSSKTFPYDTQNLHPKSKHMTILVPNQYTHSSEKALAGFLESSQNWRQRIASRPKAYLCNSMRYTWGWGSETLIQGVENESAIAGNDYVDDERRDRSGSAQTQVIASLAT